MHFGLTRDTAMDLNQRHRRDGSAASDDQPNVFEGLQDEVLEPLQVVDGLLAQRAPLHLQAVVSRGLEPFGQAPALDKVTAVRQKHEPAGLEEGRRWH